MPNAPARPRQTCPNTSVDQYGVLHLETQHFLGKVFQIPRRRRALGRTDRRPDTTPEDFDLQYKVNQFGTYLGVKFAEAAMGPDGGSIVNISSLAGLRASKGIAYVGTKWAVRGMTKTAARELGPRGIRVNSVHPGIILTPMLDAWSDEDLKTRTAQVPLGRAGMPEDVVHMVLFLLSDFSLYISGAEIAIDGGLSV